MLEHLEIQIRTLHAILGSDRDPDGRAFAPLADAYRRAGNPRKAFALLRDGLARLPDFSTGHVVAARLFTEQGMSEEGERAARRALALDPENVSAMATLVRVLGSTGRVDEAGEVFATLEAIEPEVVDEYGLERPEVTVFAEDEEVWDIALLAPDPDPAEVFGAGGAEVSDEDDVVDIAALAPDEVILDIAALAPDAPDEVILDIAALAPDVPVEMVLDIATLAPDSTSAAAEAESEDVREGVAPVWAPVADPTPPPPVELLDEAPPFAGEGVQGGDTLQDPFGHQGAPRPDTQPPRPVPSRGGAPRIYTRTLGELYARQGFFDRAVEVFRQLRAEQPDDAGLAERLVELEDQLAGRPALEADARLGANPVAGVAVDDAPGVPEVHAPAGTTTDVPVPHRDRDEELEALARDLVGHAERHPEIDTPFAWTDGVDEEGAGGPADAAEPGPTIGSYFDDLLGWQPKDGS